MEGDTHGQATQSPLQDEQAQASGNAQTQEPPVEQEQVDWAAQLAAKDAEMADMKVGYELRLAGARNVKAAKALLGEYEDDINKLKDAEPWLFVTQALMSEPGTGTGTGTASGGSAAANGTGAANGAGTASGSATGAASSSPKTQGRTGLPSAGAAPDEGKELKRWREIAGLNEE